MEPRVPGLAEGLCGCGEAGEVLELMQGFFTHTHTEPPAFPQPWGPGWEVWSKSLRLQLGAVLPGHGAHMSPRVGLPPLARLGCSSRSYGGVSSMDFFLSSRCSSHSSSDS